MKAEHQKIIAGRCAKNKRRKRQSGQDKDPGMVMDQVEESVLGQWEDPGRRVGIERSRPLREDHRGDVWSHVGEKSSGKIDEEGGTLRIFHGRDHLLETFVWGGAQKNKHGVS